MGSNRTLRANVRLVSATNRDLLADVQAGRFREDLYYRLNVIPLHMPPLRDRRADIPHLAAHFLKRYAEAFGRPVSAFTPLATQKLCTHPFPGNVRELENVVQQAIITARYSVITAGDIPVGDPSITEALPPSMVAAMEAPPGSAAPARAGVQESGAPAVDTSIPYRQAKESAIRAFERAYVERLLGEHRGNVSRAAKASELPRKSLSRIMARHGIGAGLDGSGGKPGRPPRGG